MSGHTPWDQIKGEKALRNLTKHWRERSKEYFLLAAKNAGVGNQNVIRAVIYEACADRVEEILNETHRADVQPESKVDP